MIKRILLVVLAVMLLLSVYNLFPEESLEGKADRIIVLKSERKMLVYRGDQLLKTYKIALGSEPEGHKQYKGDGRTPEGKYIISARNNKSRYHLSLRISYPNKEDKARAMKAGRSAGGDIMIHGLRFGFIGKLHRWADWTQGCIAVTNSEIEELYNSVDIGTEIEIRP